MRRERRGLQDVFLLDSPQYFWSITPSTHTQANEAFPVKPFMKNRHYGKHSAWAQFSSKTRMEPWLGPGLCGWSRVPLQLCVSVVRESIPHTTSQLFPEVRHHPWIHHYPVLP